ncbi:MAG: MFS transporter [Verrucomicrobiaceae bacterium]|nr:MAG: MFS transporter [Verrucomicrobiaceae bacterium]
MTRTQWLICIIACIGFIFDTYELLMLPLIIKPALLSLGGLQVGTPEFTHWGRILFFVPAVVGGVFGLLGGWLTDRLGRRRVLTWSILIYAFGAFAAGFATTLPQLLICRCFVFLGVCVEFVAAVAWLAEIFPEPKMREKVLGITQAFSSLGGLLVALIYSWCVRNAESLPVIHGTQEAWRYTLISGLIPAIPLIFIRPFLPESPSWQAKKDAGTLRRPSIMELFSPALIRTTLVTTALFATCYGIAFGAIQHLPQMVPGLADVKAEVQTELKNLKPAAPATPAAATTAAAEVPAPAGQASVPPAGAAKPAAPAPLSPAMKKAKAEVEQHASASVQTWQEVGGLTGRFVLAFVALHIVSRRALLRLFLIPALIFIPGLFWWISVNLGTTGIMGATKWGVFLAGVLLVGQFSFWGNYIPRVFPLHLRGTGESFAANIGGRVIGTSMAWVFFTASAATPPDPQKMALTAAYIALAMGALGLILSFFLPEPPTHDAEEEG